MTKFPVHSGHHHTSRSSEIPPHPAGRNISHLDCGDSPRPPSRHILQAVQDHQVTLSTVYSQYPELFSWSVTECQLTTASSSGPMVFQGNQVTTICKYQQRICGDLQNIFKLDCLKHTTHTYTHNRHHSQCAMAGTTCSSSCAPTSSPWPPWRGVTPGWVSISTRPFQLMLVLMFKL